MQLEKAIKTRKSVKKYSAKKPNWRKIIRAIGAARYAPMAGNQFSVKFILVSDEDKIKELAAASQQSFVGTADYAVVVVSDDSKIKKFYGIRGERYVRQQAGAAIQNFWLALTEQDLVSCWVGHYEDNQIKRALDIPADRTIEAIFPIGRETKIKAAPKRKPELENIIYFNKWKNKKMAPEARVTVEGV